MSLSISIALDTRRAKKTGKFPVKLLAIFNRKPQRYQTIYDLSEAEFKALSAKQKSEGLKKMQECLKQLQRQAEEIAANLIPFTFAGFEKAFILNNPSFHQRKTIKEISALENHPFEQVMYNNRFPIFRLPKPEPDTILSVFLFYISKLLNEHRIRTAAQYQTTYNVRSRFSGNVRFVDINVLYLKRFEVWMLEHKYSKTTVGIYTRCLRALFNEAIFQGIIKRESYPFGRRLYQPPSSRNIKKALTLEDVSKIYYYIPQNKQERKAKDFWLFSYFANGINPTDIMTLKYYNIEGEYLVFERAKTVNSTRLDPRPITVFISEDMRRIIDFWGNKDKSPDNYIFPWMEYNISPLRKVELCELFVYSINHWISKIAKKLGIEKKVSTYVARHTFSTILKRSGVSTEFIQESLGHTSMKTTESYLDSFEKSVKREYAQRLVAFKEGHD